MKNFIEVTTNENKKKLLNIKHIFMIEGLTEREANSIIYMTPRQEGTFSNVHMVYTIETYSELKQLIEESIRFV